MINKLLPRVAALAITVVLAASAAIPAAATDDYEPMSASSCSGHGYSWVFSGTGATESGGCFGSQRYLSGTIVHTNSCSYSLPGQWYFSDVEFVPNFSNCAYADVDAVAGTHNLYYGGVYNGYEGTLAS